MFSNTEPSKSNGRALSSDNDLATDLGALFSSIIPSLAASLTMLLRLFKCLVTVLTARPRYNNSVAQSAIIISDRSANWI